MDITYGITEEIYTLSSDSRTSYGIAAYSNADTDKTATIVAAVHDITNDKQKLLELVQLCNKLQLSVTHLGDVVEDFLID
jgi:hypothetical protein